MNAVKSDEQYDSQILIRGWYEMQYRPLNKFNRSSLMHVLKIGRFKQRASVSELCWSEDHIHINERIQVLLKHEAQRDPMENGVAYPLESFAKTSNEFGAHLVPRPSRQHVLFRSALRHEACLLYNMT